MDRLWETLHEFIIDYCDYLPESVPELGRLPNPTEFLNEYVQTNLPFVVRCQAAERFPAVLLWDDEKHVRNLMDKKMVTVAVTPDGRADSIVDDRFMIPEERTMLFDEFFTQILDPMGPEVYYLQKQNNNLIEEFSPLLRDVPAHIPWATEAFASKPDAANIWMGDYRSVTSIHKDHYENIYCVITGEKKFILYPPVSIGWMPYKKCKKFQWYFETTEEGNKLGKWTMKDLNEEVEWIEPSHKPPTLEQFKMLPNTKSYAITLLPGDILYMPALWFHEVHQSKTCIAVNYWYDMKYDVKYPFFNLFAKLCNLQSSSRSVSVDKQTELELGLLLELYKKHQKSLTEDLKVKEHVRK